MIQLARNFASQTSIKHLFSPARSSVGHYLNTNTPHSLQPNSRLVVFEPYTSPAETPQATLWVKQLRTPYVYFSRSFFEFNSKIKESGSIFRSSQFSLPRLLRPGRGEVVCWVAANKQNPSQPVQSYVHLIDGFSVIVANVGVAGRAADRKKNSIYAIHIPTTQYLWSRLYFPVNHQQPARLKAENKASTRIIRQQLTILNLP